MCRTAESTAALAAGIERARDEFAPGFAGTVGAVDRARLEEYATMDYDAFREARRDDREAFGTAEGPFAHGRGRDADRSRAEVACSETTAEQASSKSGWSTFRDG